MNRIWDGVCHDAVNLVWRDVQEWVRKACARGNHRYTARDIFDSLIERRTQLWIAVSNRIEALAITEIISYPQKTYARIIMGAGCEPHNIGEFLELFEVWAHERGCHGVESLMRLGFEKSFKSRGWVKTHIFMEKEF